MSLIAYTSTIQMYSMEVNNMSKMKHYYGFTTDKINIFMMLLDTSGSMERDEDNMREGVRVYHESFENFSERNSIAVSVCKFDGNFKPGEFKPLNDFDSSYYCTNGDTALFYSIVEGGEILIDYINNIIEKKHITPRVTFIVFSDGQPYNDRARKADAEEMISKLNLMGVTTVFVAFKDEISSEFGSQLGFVATKDIRNREDLVDFMGRELSQSCKKQSRSAKSLGANFFSHAASKSRSAHYSQATAQVLEDDSWMDDL